MVSVLEVIATICGLLQAYLIMNNKKESWIFYNIQMLSLLLFSIIVSLWGDVIENIVYLILGILGTTIWYNSKINIFKEIGKLSNQNRILLIMLIVVLTYLLYIFLTKTNDKLPFLDSLTTILGLVATVLMIMKKIETWILWFIDDILMAIVYFLIPEQPIYLILLNIIWIIFAIMSYIEWRRFMVLSKNGKLDYVE